MTKKELENRLKIYEGELKEEMHNEDGCFDETACSALELALECDELLDKSSSDTLIQLDKSVRDEDLEEYVDAVFMNDDGEIMFSTSIDEESTEVFTRDIFDISRDAIVDVISEIITMCIK